MRLRKFFGLIAVTFLALGLWACGETVSSTDASELPGANVIPGYQPGRTYSSQASGASSSSTAQSESSTEESSSSVDEESSSSEEESSSSEVEVDFSESEIDVDGSGVAIIPEEYLEAVASSTASDLDDLRDQLENNEEPEGFTEVRRTEFSVDDFDFSENKYYCFTDSDDWLEITKDKLLETKLPFLWGMDYYDYRDAYSLSFEDVCAAIYMQAN